MYKKFIVIMLAIIMVFTMIPAVAFAETENQSSNSSIDSILSDGILVFDSIKPNNNNYMSLLYKLGNDLYEIDSSIRIGLFDNDFSTLELYRENEVGEIIENRTVPVKWNYDTNVNLIAQKYVSKLPTDRDIVEVKDLEFISYFAAKASNKNFTEDPLPIFSSDLRSKLDGMNFTLSYLEGMGSDEAFYTDRGGEAHFKHNGIIYHFAQVLESKYEHVIYVPDDTADDNVALMEAAQNRIDEYFGKENVVKLTYEDLAYDTYLKHSYELEKYIASLNGQNFDITFEEWKQNPNNLPQYQYFDELIQVEGITEETPAYKATVGDEYCYVLIKKDSSKMVTPTYKNVDILTKVEITTENGSVPLDTMIQAQKLTSGSDYNKIMDILDVEKGEMYDLGLYSNTLGDKVSKLENGKFEVKLPVPTEMNGKDLVVYYVDQNNKVTEHEVTVKDGYAVFETDHFSIYTLAEKTGNAGGEGSSIVQPNDGDTQTGTNTSTTTPVTGDRTNLVPWIVAILVAGGIGVVASRKRKEQ